MLNGWTTAFQSPLQVLIGKPRRRCVKSILCSTQADDVSPTIRQNQTKRRAKPRPIAAANARSISDVSVGDQFIGTVVGVGGAESSWIDIGVATLTGKRVDARLRWRGPGLSKCKTLGNIVPVYVHKVNRPAARVEVRMGHAPTPSRELRPEDVRMLDTIRLAEELHGTVLGVGPYGAVVDVNVFRFGRRGQVFPARGLLTRKLFKKTWASDADLVVRDDIERKITVGDRVTVWVNAVHVPNAILLLQGEKVSEEDLIQRRKEAIKQRRVWQRRKSPSTLQVGETRHGRVEETAKFGLFVDIGVRRNGLIHYSNMGDQHRWDWKESIPTNTEVEVEVLSVDGNRIGLRLLSVEDDSSEGEAISTACVRGVPFESVVDSNALYDEEYSQAGHTKLVLNSHGDSDLARKDYTNEEEGEEDKNEEEDEDDENEEEDEVDGKEKKEGFEKFSDEYFEDNYGL